MRFSRKISRFPAWQLWFSTPGLLLDQIGEKSGRRESQWQVFQDGFGALLTLVIVTFWVPREFAGQRGQAIQWVVSDLLRGLSNRRKWVICTGLNRPKAHSPSS